MSLGVEGEGSCPGADDPSNGAIEGPARCAVEREFAFAGGKARRRRGEVEIGKADRTLQLECEMIAERNTFEIWVATTFPGRADPERACSPRNASVAD